MVQQGAGVKQQGSGQCQLAKPGRMKHPGIRGSRYQVLRERRYGERSSSIPRGHGVVCAI